MNMKNCRGVAILVKCGTREEMIAYIDEFLKN